MRTNSIELSSRARRQKYLGASLAVLAAALWAMPSVGAESVDFEPQALAKQRAEICLKATHAPIADLESDINHLAVLSETCRVEYGAKACGLSEKALESDKLEERYAYYVRRPLELRDTSQKTKIDRNKWEGKEAAASNQK